MGGGVGRQYHNVYLCGAGRQGVMLGHSPGAH